MTKLIEGLKYKDLFDFLNEKFRQEGILMKCNGKLYFTKVFCVKNGLDFSKIREKLEDTGGFCDCEVLFNSERSINGDIKLPKRSDE